MTRYIGKSARSKLGGKTLLQTQTITSSAATSVAFDLSANYDTYIFEYFGIYCSSGNPRFCFDMQAHHRGEDNWNEQYSPSYFAAPWGSWHKKGGGSGSNDRGYKTYHQGYYSNSWYADSSYGRTGTGNQGKGLCGLTEYTGANSSQPINGTLTMWTPQHPGTNTRFSAQTHYIRDNSDDRMETRWQNGATRNPGPISRIRFLFQSNNIAGGTINMYGMNPSTVVKDGSSIAAAASSATEVFENGGTTSGAYWINNLYTGWVPRLTWCEIDRGGYHCQRFSPRHLPGFGNVANHGSTGTFAVADGTEISNKHIANSDYSVQKDTGTNTNSGGSGIFNTGMRMYDMFNHTLFTQRYCHSQGSTNFWNNFGLDYDADASHSGNYGHNYQTGFPYEYGVAPRHAPMANGSYHISRIKVYQRVYSGSGGTFPNTDAESAEHKETSYVYNTTSYDAAWNEVADWYDNDHTGYNAYGYTGSKEFAKYMCYRYMAWSDDNNNGQCFYSHYVHIPSGGKYEHDHDDST